MSDVGVPGGTTVTCPQCGNQAAASDRHCSRCGAALSDVSVAREADQLELVEAERAVAAAGFDTDAELVDGRAVCPVCGTHNELGAARGTGRRARDTPTDRQDLEVLAFRCGVCASPLRLVVPLASDADRDEGVPSDDGGPGTPTSDPGGRSTPGGRPSVQSVDRPVSQASFHDEVDRFERAEPGNLRDQRDLIDDDGDDIRMYTGEPVETDEGWVLPVQQNFAGRDNIAGGGEWPDPHAEPAQPRPVDESDDGAPVTSGDRSTSSDDGSEETQDEPQQDLPSS
jgi:hypothetical protein